jgi:hypothetical protein
VQAGRQAGSQRQAGRHPPRTLINQRWLFTHSLTALSFSDSDSSEERGERREERREERGERAFWHQHKRAQASKQTEIGDWKERGFFLG